MTRMTGPDCVVMCNLINTHTHRHTPHRHKHTPTAYSRPRSSTMSNAFASGSALGSLVRDYTKEELAESCSSSSSESSGSEVEIEKMQPSASDGDGGGAAGSGGARAAPAPAPAPQARNSTQTGITGLFSKPALTAQQRKANEKRAEQRKKYIAAAVANPTAPERAAHIDKMRVVRTHTDRFRRNEAKRSRQEEEEEEEEEKEDGRGGGGSKRSRKRKHKTRRDGSASKDRCKTVSAFDRVKEFPDQLLLVERGQITCEACGRKPLSMYKQTLKNNVKGPIHTDALEKFKAAKASKQVCGREI